MKIHEYQAKALLKQYGIPVVEGKIAFSPKDAFEIAKGISAKKWAVKAQIHAGGRGKAGGVKIVTSPAHAQKAAETILGKRLVTHQTGPEGIPVEKVWVEVSTDIAHEYYIGIALDRQKNAPVILASIEGGVEIEEVAKKTPEKICKLWMDPVMGLQPYQARLVAYALGFKEKWANEVSQILLALGRLFLEKDCSLVEINPFVLSQDGKVLALDAKINFDDNALFRHADIKNFRDITQEDPLEVQAGEHNLNYISLDGNIGCMVNGAGLAMATMDIIKFHGGSPANFLDVGGGASTEMVTAAFKILLAHTEVKGILVNIFGGIMKCDVIANGIVEAARGVKIQIPLVVRLEGTNVEAGRKILKESGLPIVTAETMAQAAEEIVKRV